MDPKIKAGLDEIERNLNSSTGPLTPTPRLGKYVEPKEPEVVINDFSISPFAAVDEARHFGGSRKPTAPPVQSAVRAEEESHCWKKKRPTRVDDGITRNK